MAEARKRNIRQKERRINPGQNEAPHAPGNDNDDNGQETEHGCCTCTCTWACVKRKLSENFDIFVVVLLSTPLFISLVPGQKQVATVVWHISAVLNGIFGSWWRAYTGDRRKFAVLWISVASAFAIYAITWGVVAKYGSKREFQDNPFFQPQ